MFFLTRRPLRPLEAFLSATLLLLPRFLLAGDAQAPGALATARVGLRALAADGQAAAVTQAAVGADLHQPFDVLGAIAPQVTLDLTPLDRVAQLDRLVLGQVFALDPGVDPGLGEDFESGRVTDPEDVGEPDLDPLVIWNVDACDTCHCS